MEIGMIGLGRMGADMTERLLKGGDTGWWGMPGLRSRSTGWSGKGPKEPTPWRSLSPNSHRGELSG